MGALKKSHSENSPGRVASPPPLPVSPSLIVLLNCAKQVFLLTSQGAYFASLVIFIMKSRILETSTTRHYLALSQGIRVLPLKLLFKVQHDVAHPFCPSLGCSMAATSRVLLVCHATGAFTVYLPLVLFFFLLRRCLGRHPCPPFHALSWNATPRRCVGRHLRPLPPSHLGTRHATPRRRFLSMTHPGNTHQFGRLVWDHLALHVAQTACGSNASTYPSSNANQAGLDSSTGNES